MTLILTVILVALVFEYINGFHDTANAIATTIANKVLTPRQAVTLSAVCNLAVALVGVRVAETIGKGRTVTGTVELKDLGGGDVTKWGIAALHRAIRGLKKCKTAVHICYGYGIKANIDWKKTLGAEWRQYEQTFPLLAKSSIRQVSLECANSHVPIELIGLLEGKDVLVGAIDVATDRVESPAEVAECRLRHDFRHILLVFRSSERAWSSYARLNNPSELTEAETVLVRGFTRDSTGVHPDPE